MTGSEGVHIPSLGGATEWINTEPLDPAGLWGRVVLGELLDAYLHQLAAPGAVRSRGRGPTETTGWS